MNITGTTRIFTILAHPSTHVTAPVVFNRLFKTLGLDMAYIAHDVAPEAVGKTIEAYRCWENLGGFNVTIPHKEAVAGLVDRTLPPAGRLGVVNTVVRSPEGTLAGYNTDGLGAAGAIGDVNGAQCLVIGAGGAARAIVHALLEAGARRVLIMNRTRENTESLMRLFPEGKTGPGEMDALPQADVVIQATPVADRVPFGLDVTALRKGTRVLETVIRETALSREARGLGLEVIPGLAMLFHQTRENFRLLTGIEVSDNVVQQAFHSLGYDAS